MDNYITLNRQQASCLPSDSLPKYTSYLSINKMILCCHVSVQYISVSLMVWCLSNTTGKSLALLSTIQFVTTLQVCIKWLHWWDSIGIMFTAGTLDWYNSQYIGRESVDTWPIYWSTVSRHSVDSQSTVGQKSVDSWSTNCFF